MVLTLDLGDVCYWGHICCFKVNSVHSAFVATDYRWREICINFLLIHKDQCKWTSTRSQLNEFHCHPFHVQTYSYDYMAIDINSTDLYFNVLCNFTNSPMSVNAYDFVHMCDGHIDVVVGWSAVTEIIFKGLASTLEIGMPHKSCG